MGQTSSNSSSVLKSNEIASEAGLQCFSEFVCTGIVKLFCKFRERSLSYLWRQNFWMQINFRFTRICSYDMNNKRKGGQTFLFATSNTTPNNTELIYLSENLPILPRFIRGFRTWARTFSRLVWKDSLRFQIEIRKTRFLSKILFCTWRQGKLLEIIRTC